jgi:hypothetical protein
MSMDLILLLKSLIAPRLLGLLALILLGTTLVGCPAGIGRLVHGDPSVQVVINTEPPGARVIVDGKELGVSPLTFHDPSGQLQTFSVELRKEGYESVVRVIERKWDTMRLTYRLDPVYFYTLYPFPEARDTFLGAASRQEIQPSESLSRKGSEVDIVPSRKKGTQERDAVALVIGISKYRDEGVPRVQYARHDAEIMAAYLEAVGRVSRLKIKLLTDEGATYSDLSAYVEEWLPRRVSKNTTVFVYYAGHGTPNLATGKAFLLPYDGHADFQNKLYPLERLYENLDRLPAKEVVVMLDSCFSGATGRSVLPTGARPVGIMIENQVLASKKLAVLSASTGTQMSSNYDKEQHGLFTYFLLKGLRGEADSDVSGTVEVLEIYDYVSKKVASVASEELNRDQTPVLQPTLEQLGERGKTQLSFIGQ